MHDQKVIRHRIYLKPKIRNTKCRFFEVEPKSILILKPLTGNENKI